VSGSKPPSTKPGIEGALENLGNLGDDLQKQITDTINDPNMDATSKQAKLTQLQSQQQSVMNMLNQISQMLQNVVKMWSDIAMNSVRNMK
jgi:flagellin-like hook-associated protein FlgL